VSNDEKAAILGRTMLELKDTKEHLAYLQAQAREISARLGLLATYLSGNIQFIQFADWDQQAQYQPTSNDGGISRRDTFKVSEIDGKNIAALVQEIRVTTTKLMALEKQTKDFGF
jgi:hypothetical protein